MKAVPLIAATLFVSQFALPAAARPNVVILYADDLGYGDLGCYGATQISTPRIDSLAREGVRFQDAHAAAAVCNPSRYSLLTGKYLWNASRKGDNYAWYFADGEPTLPEILKNAGYRTAAFGKWHNGFGCQREPDWNSELKPGPLGIGFESFFGTPRSHNEPPFVFVENYREPKPWGQPFRTLGIVNSDIDENGDPLPSAAPVQLYDLKADLGQSKNIAAEHPDVVERLSSVFGDLSKPRPSPTPSVFNTLRKIIRSIGGHHRNCAESGLLGPVTIETAVVSNLK